MPVNHVLIVGRVSKTGPKLSYASNGTPVCSLVLEVDEAGKTGELFTTYLPVEITGRYAEQTAAEVEAGAGVQDQRQADIQARGRSEGQARVSQLGSSTWGLTQRIAAPTPAVSANEWRRVQQFS
jgi:hypothetical protein